MELTVEMLGTVTGCTVFIYLATTLFVKPVIARKTGEWREKWAGIVTNYGAIILGQLGAAIAGLALHVVGIDAWFNLGLIGLMAAGASTGIYEIVKNASKSRS